MGENTFFISLVSMLYLTECVFFFFNLTRSVNCYSSPSSLGIRHVFQSLKPLQLIRGFFFLNSMSMIEEVKEPNYIINKLRRRQDTFGGRFRSGKCYK